MEVGGSCGCGMLVSFELVPEGRCLSLLIVVHVPIKFTVIFIDSWDVVEFLEMELLGLGI